MRQKFIIVGTVLLFLSGCQNGISIGRKTESNSSSSGGQTSLAAEKKMYRNEQYGFQVELPANWSVDQELSNRDLSGEDIFFDTGIDAGEVHEGIKVDVSKGGTVEDLVKKIDKNIIWNISDISVDGEKGKRVDTTEFAQIIILVPHGGFIYQFTTGGAMISEGVLASVHFLR